MRLPASHKHCLWRCGYDVLVCAIYQGVWLLKEAMRDQKRPKQQTNSQAVEDTAGGGKRTKKRTNWPSKLRTYEVAYIKNGFTAIQKMVMIINAY